MGRHSEDWHTVSKKILGIFRNRLEISNPDGGSLLILLFRHLFSIHKILHQVVHQVSPVSNHCHGFIPLILCPAVKATDSSDKTFSSTLGSLNGFKGNRRRVLVTSKSIGPHTHNPRLHQHLLRDSP